jgi:hypothetical protein
MSPELEQVALDALQEKVRAMSRSLSGDDINPEVSDILMRVVERGPC